MQTANAHVDVQNVLPFYETKIKKKYDSIYMYTVQTPVVTIRL